MSKPVASSHPYPGSSINHWGSPFASYHPDFRPPAPKPNWEKMSPQQILDYCEQELTSEQRAQILQRMMNERPAPPVWYTTKLPN